MLGGADDYLVFGRDADAPLENHVVLRDNKDAKGGNVAHGQSGLSGVGR